MIGAGLIQVRRSPLQQFEAQRLMLWRFSFHGWFPEARREHFHGGVERDTCSAASPLQGCVFQIQRTMAFLTVRNNGRSATRGSPVFS
jgi:hypothetical protein